MAVVSRIADLELTIGVSTRRFTATAVSQDTAAGASVDVTVTESTTGALPPDAPDALLLEFYIDNGTTLIRTVTLPARPSTQTFFFTANGLSGGGNRAGTVRIRLRAQRTGGAPTARYDVNTDGANPPDTLATGMTVTVRDQGFIRGSTTATSTISNISAGGGDNSPYAFNDTMFHRIVLGATPYESMTFTHTFGPIAETTASAATTIDKTLAGIVDKRFAAASAVRTATCSVANATLGTGLAEIPLTLTDDTATVDPRVTCEHLMQMDNSEFASPPLSLNDTDDQRLSSQLAYFATNLRHARGTKVGNIITGGINGIAYHRNLESQVDTNIDVPADSTTATKGGEAGWGLLSSWSNALPGGTWRKTVTITNATQQLTLTDAYLLNATKDYVLVAVDPRVGIQAAVTRPSVIGEHTSAGTTIEVAAWVMNLSTGTKEAPDAGTMLVAVVRYNPTVGVMQHLISDTDNTSAAWDVWDVAEPLNYFALAVLPADARVFIKLFSFTAGWGTADVRFLFKGSITGTPYAGFEAHELVAAHNKHSGNAFDPTGLFK